MVDCENCGVALDEHMNFCPLCGVPVINKYADDNRKVYREKHDSSKKLKDEIKYLNKVQKRKFYWEVISIILAAGVFSSLLLNFIINITSFWSLYVLAGGLAVFCYTSLFLFVRKSLHIIGGVFLISIVFLLGLDLINQNLNWSVYLGLPLLLAVGVMAVLLKTIVNYVREKGFNLIAYFVLASAVLSIAVESLISLYHRQVWQVSWSAIAFFSTLPVAFILLYFHYKLGKGSDLRKFFHI